MKCATSSVVLLCVLINCFVYVQSDVTSFVTWINNADPPSLTQTCTDATPDLKTACKGDNAANCPSTKKRDTATCDQMCEAFKDTYSCGQEDLQYQMKEFTKCADHVSSATAYDEAKECMKEYQTEAEKLVAWIKDEKTDDGLSKTCTNAITANQKTLPNLADECKGGNAADCDNDDCKDMCDAFGNAYKCDMPDLRFQMTDFTPCCQGCIGQNPNDLAKQDSCCQDCAIVYTTKAPPPVPGPTTGKTPAPAPTTAKPPAPGPTPAPSPEDTTTTMESTSTEEGGSDDSAYPLGPSGLLVALITAIMVAVVNIA